MSILYLSNRSQITCVLDSYPPQASLILGCPRLKRFIPSSSWESQSMTHSQSDRISPAMSIFFAVSLCFFLSLFYFSSLNLTFSLSSTTATLSGLDAPNLKLPGWRPSTTMPAGLFSVNVKGPLHRLLVGN